MSTSHKVKNPLQYDFLFKLLFVGDNKVGKTCLILRFADDIYNEGPWPTFGPDFKIRNVDVDGSTIKLQLWDIRTDGERWGRPVIASYYRSVHGIFIVYDVTNAESFNNVTIWLNEITKHNENVSKLLVGNKSDLDSNRAVTFEQGQELAKSMGIEFIETSAKNSTNVEKAFLVLTTQIKERRGSQPVSDFRRGVKLTSGQLSPGQMVTLNNRGCCC